MFLEILSKVVLSWWGSQPFKLELDPPSNDLVHRHCLYRSGKGSPDFQRSGPRDTSLCFGVDSPQYYLKYVPLLPQYFTFSHYFKACWLFLKDCLCLMCFFQYGFQVLNRFFHMKNECFFYIVRAISVTGMVPLTCNSRPTVEWVVCPEHTG